MGGRGGDSPARKHVVAVRIIVRQPILTRAAPTSLAADAKPAKRPFSCCCPAGTRTSIGGGGSSESWPDESDVAGQKVKKFPCLHWLPSAHHVVIQRQAFPLGLASLPSVPLVTSASAFAERTPKSRDICGHYQISPAALARPCTSKVGIDRSRMSSISLQGCLSQHITPTPRSPTCHSAHYAAGISPHPHVLLLRPRPPPPRSPSRTSSSQPPIHHATSSTMTGQSPRTSST